MVPITNERSSLIFYILLSWRLRRGCGRGDGDVTQRGSTPSFLCCPPSRSTWAGEAKGRPLHILAPLPLSSWFMTSERPVCTTLGAGKTQALLRDVAYVLSPNALG